MLLWRSTNSLWDAGERQLALIKQSAEKQAEDTRILQRAYLTVLRGGIDFTTQGQVLGQIVIFNAGHLPARKVSSNVRILWSSDRSENTFVEPRIPQQTNVLPVGTKMPIGTGSLESGRQRLSTGIGFIYVWGKVTYEDGFGEHRWVLFCHRYNCASPKNGHNGIDAEYGRYHHHHNDAN